MKAVLSDSWVAGMCVRLICGQWRHVKPLRSSDESDDALFLKTVCLTAGRVPRSAKVWLGLNDCVCVHPRKCATLHTQFINSPNVCGVGICQECDSNISHLLSLLPAFYSPLHTLFQPCWCLLQSVFLSPSPFGSLSSFNVSHCLFSPFTQRNMSFSALILWKHIKT